LPCGTLRHLLVYSPVSFVLPIMVLVYHRIGFLHLSLSNLHFSEYLFILSRGLLVFTSAFYHYCKPLYFDHDDNDSTAQVLCNDSQCSLNLMDLYQGDVLACVFAVHVTILQQCDYHELPSSLQASDAAKHPTHTMKKNVLLVYWMTMLMLAPFLIPYVLYHGDESDNTLTLVFIMAVVGLCLRVFVLRNFQLGEHLVLVLVYITLLTLCAMLLQYGSAFIFSTTSDSPLHSNEDSALRYNDANYALRHAAWHIGLALADCAVPFLFQRVK
jgi:hypothetical protein